MDIKESWNPNNARTNESSYAIKKGFGNEFDPLFLPTSMFQLKCDGKGRDGEIKARQFKCLIDGCSKRISLSVYSGCEAKRHVKLCHPTKLADYFLLMQKYQRKVDFSSENVLYETEEIYQPKLNVRFSNRKIQTQRDFDICVLDYLVKDILPMETIQNYGFSTFLAKMNPEFVLESTQFYKNLLSVQYKERKEELIAALQNATWVSTTTDCWLSYGKSFIGKTVHWYDNNLQRHKACLGVREYEGKVDDCTLGLRLFEIYREFKIEKKIESTVIDGGSTFIEALLLHSHQLQAEWSIHDENPDMALSTQDKKIKLCDFSNECQPIPVFGRFQHECEVNKYDGSYDDVCLHQIESFFRVPNLRQCSAQLLKTIIKVHTTTNMQQEPYNEVLNRTVEKIQAACSKTDDYSATIKRIIGSIFITFDKTKWTSDFKCMKCFSKLLIKKNYSMHQLFNAIGIVWFRSDEQEFIHEYVKIMQPVVDAFDVLNGDISITASYLLPTITILRLKLENIQQDTKIKHTHALVFSLLKSLEDRFGYMYQIKELRLAAVCDPKFKLEWLPNEEKETYKKLLQEVYDRWKSEDSEEDMECSDSEVEYGGCTKICSSPRKKKNFFHSLIGKKGSTKMGNEVDSFLADPLGDLQQLLQYPILTKIFKKFNAAPASSAFVERLFSKIGMVFISKTIPFPEKTLDMLLFLNSNSKEICSW